MNVALLLHAVALTVAQAPAPDPGAAPPRELWAGQAILVGELRLPILGKVETKTDTLVLAEVVRTAPNKLTLVQRACAIRLGNPPGVSLSIDDRGAQRLPVVKLDFERRADGLWYQAPNASAWKDEDVDGDGHPGMSVDVDATLCAGKLYVGLATNSVSRGRLLEGGGMTGELRSRVVQTVLDSDSTCLSVLVRGSDDRARGTFTYAPVPPDATCASLAKAPWPAAAEAPASKKR